LPDRRVLLRPSASSGGSRGGCTRWGELCVEGPYFFKVDKPEEGGDGRREEEDSKSQKKKNPKKKNNQKQLQGRNLHKRTSPKREYSANRVLRRREETLEGWKDPVWGTAKEKKKRLF